MISSQLSQPIRSHPSYLKKTKIIHPIIKSIGSNGRVFKYKKEYDISYFAWKRDIIPKEKYGFLLAEKRFDQKFGKVEEKFDIKEEPMEN